MGQRGVHLCTSDGGRLIGLMCFDGGRKLRLHAVLIGSGGGKGGLLGGGCLGRGVFDFDGALVVEERVDVITVGGWAGEGR